MMSFWKTPDDDWAVCDGPGPTGVKGYIERSQDGYRIRGDESCVKFMDLESAGSRILDVPVNGTSEYMVSKDTETRIVRTYPDSLELLKRDGWSVVTGFATS
jgi:hypothetical protein